MNKEPLVSLNSIDYDLMQAKELCEGAIVQHYNNRQFYKVLGVFRDTEKANVIYECRVGYQQLYSPFEKFQRLINEFLGFVLDKEGNPIKRFKLVDKFND